jgi:hypothetical protein
MYSKSGSTTCVLSHRGRMGSVTVGECVEVVWAPVMACSIVAAQAFMVVFWVSNVGTMPCCVGRGCR